jgi:hypothetical protein
MVVAILMVVVVLEVVALRVVMVVVMVVMVVITLEGLVATLGVTQGMGEVTTEAEMVVEEADLVGEKGTLMVVKLVVVVFRATKVVAKGVNPGVVAKVVGLGAEAMAEVVVDLVVKAPSPLVTGYPLRSSRSTIGIIGAPTVAGLGTIPGSVTPPILLSIIPCLLMRRLLVS